MTLCVYALVSGPVRRVSLTGMAGERLRVVTHDTVSAVVGELRRSPRAAPAMLRRHDAVVRTLAARFPAVLPARFGSCFPGEQELAFILRARQQPLRRALRRVRGRAQMTVRMVGVKDNEETAVHPTPPTGTAYLRARARAREVPGFEPVRAAVSRWVRDERVEKRAAVATVYHLIPRASAAAYVRALTDAAAASGLNVLVTGPWPPYAFAAGDLS